MGNCSCANKSRNALNCFGASNKSRRQKSRNSPDVLPEDLHASSGQKVKPEVNTSAAQRPNSLEIQAVAQEENLNSRFPAFSLHGIQKSTPSTGGNDSPIIALSMEKVNLAKIVTLFESYRDDSSDAVLAEGVERFCVDLDVDPTEFIVLALAWKFKAETMCRFSRKEFVDGFVEMLCDSIEGLKSTFKLIESDALENFKDLYRYTFQFALDADQGQRSLPCNIATAMWDVVFSRNPPALLQPWIDFLQENNIRGISRDTWNMFLYLTECLNEDLSNYNDNEAWPSLFDDFVDYQRERMKETKVEVLQAESEDGETSLGGDSSQQNTPDSITTRLADSNQQNMEESTEPALLLPTEIPGSVPPSSDTSDSNLPPNEIAASVISSTEILASEEPSIDLVPTRSSTDIPELVAPSNDEIPANEADAIRVSKLEHEPSENQDLLQQLHAAVPHSSL